MVLCYYLTTVDWGSITMTVKFLMEGLSRVTEVETQHGVHVKQG